MDKSNDMLMIKNKMLLFEPLRHKIMIDCIQKSIILSTMRLFASTYKSTTHEINFTIPKFDKMRWHKGIPLNDKIDNYQ